MGDFDLGYDDYFNKSIDYTNNSKDYFLGAEVAEVTDAYIIKLGLYYKNKSLNRPITNKFLRDQYKLFYSLMKKNPDFKDRFNVIREDLRTRTIEVINS